MLLPGSPDLVALEARRNPLFGPGFRFIEEYRHIVSRLAQVEHFGRFKSPTRSVSKTILYNTSSS